MHVGVVFPQTEIGSDRGAVRAYADAVNELGYHHLLAYDHVVGADPQVHQGWNGPYSISDTFHEPMVLFGYLAACTDLELVSGILIAPQRQTVLVGQAGRRGRRPVRRPPAPRGRSRMEPSRVRGALQGLLEPGHPDRRAGRAAPPPVHRGERDLRGPLRAAPRGGDLFRCPSSGRSRSGSVASRRRRCAASGGSPTGGSRSCAFGPALEAAVETVQQAAEAAGRPPIPFEGRISVNAGRGQGRAAPAPVGETRGVPRLLDTMRQGFVARGPAHLCPDRRRPDRPRSLTGRGPSPHSLQANDEFPTF